METDADLIPAENPDTARRWMVLGILVLMRAGVGFQFVALAALMPILKSELAFNYTQIGLLLGVFLLSGLFLSIPAGMIASWFGEHRTLQIGLGSLILGGVLVAWSDTFTWILIGRLMGGIGAVFTSVIGSKLITDWFLGREIGTAMSLFGLTWPAGIALGMYILPFLGDWQGWKMAILATCFLPALAFPWIWFIPSHADNPKDANPVSLQTGVLWSLGTREFFIILVAGLAWPLMNGGGYILFTTYAPGLLMEQGRSTVSANLITGMLSWLILITIPIGGYLTDLTGKKFLMFLLGCLFSAAGIGMLPFGGSTFLWVVLSSGLGLTVGAVMSLPGDILSGKSRATGFGLYYSLYYLGMSTIPAMGGWVLDQTESHSMVIWFSAFCLLLAPLFYGGAKVLQQHWKIAEQHSFRR